VFAVGDEAFQRRCVDRILEFKQQGRTIAFVSHAGAVVERMCDRAILLRQGLVEYDGETSEAIRRYQQLLADEEDPEERAAGLREWGSGEARVTDVRLEGGDGQARDAFVAGDSLGLVIDIETFEAITAPVLGVELRDMSGALLARSEQALGELGWDGNRRAQVRFDVDRLPLVEGRFQFNLTLTDPDGNRRYHAMEKAAEFVVFSAGHSRGIFLFEGDWSLEQASSAVSEPASSREPS
jgi:Wzt C-terminal domain